MSNVLTKEQKVEMALGVNHFCFDCGGKLKGVFSWRTATSKSHPRCYTCWKTNYYIQRELMNAN